MGQKAGEVSQWQLGDHVLLRYRRKQPADVIVPVTVVEQTANHVALYVMEGTPIKSRFTFDGKPQYRSIPFVEPEQMPVVLGDTQWHSTNVL